MKATTLKAEITVPVDIKQFAIVLAMLDPMYSGLRETFIRRLVRYYQVTV